MLSRHALFLLSLIIIAANFVYIGWYTALACRSPLKGSLSYTYRGHDHPRTLPLPFDDLPSVPVTFKEDEEYAHLGPDYDDKWFSLTSASYGYVRLGLTDRLFTVTMFHELHCLRILNLAFGRHSVASLAHIQHCLNYLRLGSLCASDLTLEAGNFEEENFETERIGATHTCRDWSVVYPVVDDNFYAWRNKTLDYLEPPPF